LEALHTRFAQSFDKVAQEHPLNLADAWNVTHLQPWATYHAPSVDRHLLEARAPHMDYELVDFLLTIPPYARLEQRVYKRMIAYSFPTIRDVPCTNNAAPIDPHFLSAYAAMAARYAARKVTAPLRGAFGARNSLGREFRDLDEDFRAEPELANNLLRPMLHEDVFPSDTFDLEAIGSMIDDHYNRRGNHEFYLSRLVTLGLALKFFLHDDLSEVPAEMYAP
jgi:asparagine synthetase B (glutamine-hydrolysing)